ncbi:serine aminopeptidase domain-containing protein, partial [Singulisphaera rosea]
WAGDARPGLPRFVLGHSNGGQLALRLGLENPHGLTGLILSNPSLVVATRVSRVKLAVGRFLLKHAPHVTLSAKLPAEMMTRDPEMQADHHTDPLRHSRISAPLYFGMTDGGRAVLDRASELIVPTLFLLGESDPVIDPSATRRFFEREGSADKTLNAYPGMRHEPLNEFGREQVFSDLSAWLDARLRPV